MDWLKSTFGSWIPTPFSFKYDSKQYSGNAPDLNCDLDIYDDTEDGDTSSPLNRFSDNSSNPRNAMLKKFNDNEPIEEDSFHNHNNPQDMHPFFDNGLNNLFNGGIFEEVENLVGAIFGAHAHFNGFNNSRFHGPRDGEPSFFSNFSNSDSRNLLKDGDEPPNSNLMERPTTSFNFKSTSVSRVTQPDGTIVEKRTYKDSFGNNEETVTTIER